MSIDNIQFILQKCSSHFTQYDLFNPKTLSSRINTGYITSNVCLMLPSLVVSRQEGERKSRSTTKQEIATKGIFTYWIISSRRKVKRSMD